MANKGHLVQVHKDVTKQNKINKDSQSIIKSQDYWCDYSLPKCLKKNTSKQEKRMAHCL